MADHSHIEWTDATWNPIVGCSITSPGCTNCYAMAMARRIEAMQPGSHYAGTTQVVKGNPVWTGRTVLAPEHTLFQPLRWKRGRTIFVNSMGDLFHEDVPDEWIDRIFAVMCSADWHTYQVLTKRSARMLAYMTAPGLTDRIADAQHDMGLEMHASIPAPNIWLGVSTEDQRRADERVPDLLATPAALHFISAEPMLGPIHFDRIEESADTFADCGGHPDPHWPRDTQDWHWLDALSGRCEAEARAPDGTRRGDIDVGLKWTGGKIAWIIAGGESGPNARPMHRDWVRSIRDQCAAASVPFFFKQWGAYRRVDGFHIAATAETVPGALVPSGKAFLAVDRIDDGAAVGVVLRRAHKKAAGRLLDGREHNELPIQPRRAS
ncbi:hypothetical protein GCM10007301_15030 [Azorhizobium oxalatiphilum]|uniref:Phage Gp37/Gp68 family protein n=1 Tax=Azorhizobium oxalatiphilum TaxID=980631 RepID=A0A917F9Y2_9HYPH|nr:phage Gp37/Gp68 family protein [Azorhizobium oxalatiphilum]GGF56390.1 hypothetical protein GCM10007301_15030 [Azorhizobium oxalatiphilum]